MDSKSIHELRAQGWADMIRRRNESGLSVKEFCQQEGIVTQTYYKRQSKLREQLIEARKEYTGNFVEMRELMLPEPERQKEGCSAKVCENSSAVIRYGDFTIEIKGNVCPSVYIGIGEMIKHAL